MKNKILFVFLTLFILLGCESRDEILNDIFEEENKYDRYEDVYENYKYKNKNLGLTLEFDENWIIIPEFENFDDLQKKYAKYFSSIKGEVLFVGYNDKRKIGIRCTCEKLGMDNSKYLEKIKSVAKSEINDYQIKFLTEEEINLKNTTGTNLILETTINKNNIFIFNSIFLKE